jgi:uncharacterized protein (DUF849 family)
MLSLMRAMDDRPDTDPDEVRQIIHAIAEAQDRLLKITAAAKQDQPARVNRRTISFAPISQGTRPARGDSNGAGR